MALTAKDKGGGKDFDPTPEGMHHGICIGIYDLGHQFSEKWGKSSHKCVIMWELPNVRIDIETNEEKLNLPRAISKQFTVSLHEKSSLRKTLQSWRGKAFTVDELKGFDILKILGANATVQVIHTTRDDRTYANVEAVMPLMSGDKLKPENPLRSFSFETDSHPPEGTPEWILKLINESEERTATDKQDEYPQEPDFAPDEDDDMLIPF